MIFQSFIVILTLNDKRIAAFERGRVIQLLNVAESIISKLFPKYEESSIPI